MSKLKWNVLSRAENGVRLLSYFDYVADVLMSKTVFIASDVWFRGKEEKTGRDLSDGGQQDLFGHRTPKRCRNNRITRASTEVAEAIGKRELWASEFKFAT